MGWMTMLQKPCFDHGTCGHFLWPSFFGPMNREDDCKPWDFRCPNLEATPYPGFVLIV